MDIPASLPPSTLRDRLLDLEAVYRRADADVEAFAAASGIACVAGCGACCRGFVPDVLPVEASYMAALIVAGRPEAAHAMASGTLAPLSWPDGSTGCPLYDDDNPLHCTVYQARPLVCRMFGFSGLVDRLGRLSYSLCRVMAAPARPSTVSNPASPRSAREPDLEAIFGALPPVMSGPGAELVGLDPAASGRRRPLTVALPEALSAVLFLAGLHSDCQAEPSSVSSMP